MGFVFEGIYFSIGVGDINIFEFFHRQSLHRLSSEMRV